MLQNLELLVLGFSFCFENSLAVKSGGRDRQFTCFCLCDCVT